MKIAQVNKHIFETSKCGHQQFQKSMEFFMSQRESPQGKVWDGQVQAMQKEI